MLKVDDFLSQPEVLRPQSKDSQKPEYAIHIESKNFSWGVQSMDVDEWFEKMAK